MIEARIFPEKKLNQCHITACSDLIFLPGVSQKVANGDEQHYKINVSPRYKLRAYAAHNLMAFCS